MLKKLSFKATRPSADDKWPPTLESCLDCRVAAASLPRSPRRTFEIIVCAQYVLGATRASMLSSVRCFGQMAVSNGKSIFTKRSLPLLFFRFKKAKQKESNKKPVGRPGLHCMKHTSMCCHVISRTKRYMCHWVL